MNERKIDYKQFEGDRIISVSDVCREILRKIWLVIILAVAFAVIFAGYKYMSDKSKTEEAAGTASYEKAAASLSDEEMGEVNNILRMYDDVADTEQYMSESIQMSIDPYHEDCVVMQYALDVEEGSVTPIMQMLGNYVSEGPLATDLQEFYPDIDSSYLSELITFESESPIIDLSGSEDVIFQSNVFFVQVSHVDAESCQQLADDVQQCLDNYLRGISGYFDSCTCTLLKEYASQIYDRDLETLQESKITNQVTMQNRIDTQTAALSDEQAQILEVALAGGDFADTSESTVTASAASATKVHISRRYTLYGLLVGIVLGIVLIILYYLCRGTLNIAQEMQSTFGISVFGQVNLKKQRNPLVRWWNRVTSKKKPLSLETEQEIALTNLKNYCKNNQINHLLLTGSQRDLSENAWLKEVQTALQEDQIETEILGGLPESPEALEKMNSFPCIALVETLHTSVYRDVVREVEVCEEQQVQVAGAIVLN